MAEEGSVWETPLLLAKARRFVEEACASNRDDWHYPFWSTLALEALVRAAIAHVSPVMLADNADRSGHHLMYAIGLTPPGNYVPSSVGFAEALRRCDLLFDRFTSEQSSFCRGMSGARNEELHSGGTPFSELEVKQWLPRYYQTASILLNEIGESLEALFDDEADAAREMIAALEDDAAKAVGKLVAAHKTIWESKDDVDQVSARSIADKTAVRQEGHVIGCPACGSKALLEGDEVGMANTTFEDELLVERQAMLPTGMTCTACGLRVDGHSKLNALGLGGTFTRKHHYDPVDYYAEGLEAYMEPDYNE